jgi:2-polyprenyl-3-methyl-5-hydroxy-6-metoxy-1,4-benzoquinol methylase
MEKKEGFKNCRICGTPTSRIGYSFKKPYKMYKCNYCSLIFLEPMPEVATIRSFYSEAYFKRHKLQYFKELGNEAIESRIRLAQAGVKYEVYPFKTKGRLLEVGCASGFFLKAAERLGWKVIGVETSEFASNFASRKLGLEIINGRLEDTDLPKGSFDVIVMFMVLEHMTKPLEILKIVKSYLKSNGIAIIKVPNYRCLESLIFGKNWHQLSFPYHLYIFSPAAIIKLAQRLNFKILKLSTYRHFSNFINPNSKHICGRLVQESASLKTRSSRLKNFIRFFYKAVLSIVDERLLLGEQLRIVLQNKE